MKNGLFFTSLCSLGVASSAWTIPSTSTSTSASSSRRSFLDKATKIVPLVIVGAPSIAFAEDEVVPPPQAEASAAAPVAVVSETPAVAESVATADAPTIVPASEAPAVAESVATTDAATIVPAFVEEEPAAPAPAPVELNDFIARLQAQSEANRGKNKALAERSDKLSTSQFVSQYDRPSFVGVYHRDDGKVTMVLKAELDTMMAQGQVVQTYQSKVSKKTGEISDDYTRPIFAYAN